VAAVLGWPMVGHAQAPAWQDCAGRVLVLGTQSLAEGAGFSHWATLSNPGMRPVRVETRFGEGAPAGSLRIEAGRTERLRLGEGVVALTPEQMALALRLRCQMIRTQP